MLSQRHLVLHPHTHTHTHTTAEILKNVCGKIKWKNGLWYQSNRLISFQIICANFPGDSLTKELLMFEYTTLAWSNT